MKKLFAKTESLCDKRSVSVMDLPGCSAVIFGNTLQPDGSNNNGNLVLSDKALEILRVILNQRKSEMEMDTEPF